ncbi:MAG: AAA family ATPase [Nanoarchaeota archaeon]
MKFNRIYIFGTSGAGKTTIAKILSRKLKIPPIMISMISSGKENMIVNETRKKDSSF